MAKKYTAEDLAKVLSINNSAGTEYTKSNVTPKMLSAFQKGMDIIHKQQPDYDIFKNDYDGPFDDDFVDMVMQVATDAGIELMETKTNTSKTKVNEAFVGDKVKTPSGKEGYITSITKEKAFVLTDDGKTEEIPTGDNIEITEATDYEENLPPRIPMFEDFKAARSRK